MYLLKLASIHKLVALARYNNDEYCKFIKILKESEKSEVNSKARVLG